MSDLGSRQQVEITPRPPRLARLAPPGARLVPPVREKAPRAWTADDEERARAAPREDLSWLDDEAPT